MRTKVGMFRVIVRATTLAFWYTFFGIAVANGQTGNFATPMSPSYNAPASLDKYWISGTTQTHTITREVDIRDEKGNKILDENRNPKKELITETVSEVVIPTYVFNTNFAGRPTVATDTTRLDPGALGTFLPSAIPAKGQKFFNTGERTNVIGPGAGTASLQWLGALDDSAVAANGKIPTARGYATAVTAVAPDGSPTVALSNAYFQWKRLTIGVANTTFTDNEAIPETIDIAGPNALPSINNVNGKGAAQIRYQFLPLASESETGIYGFASAEAPNPQITLPTAVSQGGVQHFSSFSPMPDFIFVFGYHDGETVTPYCAKPGTKVFDEYSHIQIGTIVRDLGVENDSATIRDTALGWGLQLSGGYTIFRRQDQDRQIRDVACFGVTYGKGIARYFNDLSLVSPVNDAIESTTLTPLGVFGFYVGYIHEWNASWRSTTTYSHLTLQDVPNTPAFMDYYRQGDYVSVNLIRHFDRCTNNQTDKAVFHHLYFGCEAIYGQKQDVASAFGNDYRFLFMIGATN